MQRREDGGDHTKHVELHKNLSNFIAEESMNIGDGLANKYFHQVMNMRHANVQLLALFQ